MIVKHDANQLTLISSLTGFWGTAVYVWTRFRINYIYLFDFDPRNVDTPVDIFNDCVDETLVFLVCMLMYYKVSISNITIMIFAYETISTICL